jgi:heat shock protein HslJ
MASNCGSRSYHGTRCRPIGTNRALDTITEGEVALDAGRTGDLVFAADGSVSGSTGCNSLFGSYAAATGFSWIGTTKMA